MRIGIFTDAYEPQISGVTVSNKILKTELEKLGHEILIFTLEHPLQIEDPTVIRFKGRPFPMKSLREYRYTKVTNKLVREIAKYDLDIIHCHTEFTMGRLGRRAAKKYDIPVIHTYHTMYEDYCHHVSKMFSKPLKFLSKVYSKKFADSADKVIFPTIKVKRTFDKYGYNKPSAIVPTGIYLDKFRKINFNKTDIEKLGEKYGIKKDDFVWLFIGRLSREKNVTNLIQEFSKLSLSSNNKLLIVGDGPDKEHFSKLAEKLNIKDSVIFTGMVSPNVVPMYYQLGDLFVNFSDTETQGLTYIEALASGLPVLAKYDSNLEGVIINDFNGITFNSNAEFKEAYYNLTSNKVKFNEITNNASKAIEKFSAQNFAKNIEMVYYEVKK